MEEFTVERKIEIIKEIIRRFENTIDTYICCTFIEVCIDFKFVIAKTDVITNKGYEVLWSRFPELQRMIKAVGIDLDPSFNFWGEDPWDIYKVDLNGNFRVDRLTELLNKLETLKE